MIVQAKSVQDELKLTDDQKDKVKEFAKEQVTKMREGFAKMKDRPKDKEKGKDGGGRMAEMEKAATEGLSKILKDDQMKRLKEISLQAGGVNAFHRSEVLDALKLKDEQKEKIEETLKSTGKEIRDLREEYFSGGSRPDEDKMKEFEKKSATIQKDAMGKVQEVLTDDQKKAWKDMTGETFDVVALRGETQKMMKDMFEGMMPKKKGRDESKDEKKE